jgi:hypothetical protein
MAFRFKGFTYDLWVRPWKKGKAKYEALKWKTGFKCTWGRISFEEFEKARKARLEAGKK